METYITGQHKTRRCKACGRDLPIECYRTAWRTPDRISYRCNQCLDEGKSLKYGNTTTQPEEAKRVDITKTLNEVIREQAESTITSYIAECERQVKAFDLKINAIKLERHRVAVNLANARRKISQ